MTDVPTTIDRIEQRIAEREGSLYSFLASANIAPSTWWRWKNGMSPKLRTWDRALTAAKELE